MTSWMMLTLVMKRDTLPQKIHYVSKYVTHHTKRDLMGIAKSIDPCQPVQSTQAEQGRNFSLLADFLCIKW